MKSKLNTIWSVLFAVCTVQSAFPQMLPDNQVVNMMDYWSGNHYSERVLAVLDRDIYFSGDEIRMSVFLIEPTYHLPRGASNVLSVELLDASDRPVIREKFTLEEARGAAVLKIPESLLTGNYTLRVYTNWMRNLAAPLFFHTTVTIVNPDRAPANIHSGTTRTLNVSFHPEGGSLVAGIRNHVVVRITNSFDQVFRSDWYLTTALGDTLTEVRLDSLGTGSFEIVPQLGMKAGIVHFDSLYALPQADPAAIAIRVLKENEQVSLSLEAGPARAEQEPLAVFIHRHGVMSYFEWIQTDHGKSSRSIPLKYLPDGVSELVVLDSELEFLASRLMYQPMSDRPSGAVILPPAPLSKRDSATVEFSTLPGAMVSAAVYLPGSRATMNSDPADEYMLSGYTGIRGATGQDQIDRTLLIAGNYFEGYRSLAQTDEFTFPPELRGQLITGTLLNGERALADNYKLYMANLGKNTDIEQVIFQDDGSFYISPTEQEFADQLVFLNDALEKLNILIQPVFHETYAPAGLPEFDPLEYPFLNLDKLLLASQVRRLYHMADTSLPVRKTYKFYGDPDQTVLLSDYIRLPVMEEFFRELVKTTIITREEGKLKINVLSKYTNRITGPDPMYIVDGIPVFDTRTILDMDPELVKAIHVVASKYYYGNLEMDGIVDIETYAGDGSILELDDNIASYRYQPSMKVYPDDIQRANGTVKASIPDQRTVICWQPLLQADEKGKGSFSFVTSDVTGEYLLRVTFLTRDGRIGSIERPLPVQ